MLKLILPAIATLVFSGCASLDVDSFEPKPNIDVEGEKLPTELKIADSVKDTYQVSARAGVPSFKVLGWRQSLSKGFENGFAGPASNSLKPTILQLLRADLEFAAVGTSKDGITGYNALVTFDARLLDGSGKILKRSTGTVKSKIVMVRVHQQDDCARSATESMYEKIAKDFF